MKDDIVLQLLKQVKSGKVSIEDARSALEGVDLSEENYLSAVDHGVFNEPDAGTIVRSSISPAGDSIVVVLVGLWGVLWTFSGQVHSVMASIITGINNFYPCF
jgi:hypothetical protein